MDFKQTKITKIQRIDIGTSLMTEDNQGNITNVINDVAKYFLHTILRQKEYILTGKSSKNPNGSNWSLKGNMDYWYERTAKLLEQYEAGDTNVIWQTAADRHEHAALAYNTAVENFAKFQEAFELAMGEAWKPDFFDVKTDVNKTIKEVTDKQMSQLLQKYGVSKKEEKINTVDDRTGTDG